MANIYATLIINGKKSFADVPESIKAAVQNILDDHGFGNLAE